MDDLKAKISAIFAEDDPFVGIGKSSYDKADRVLALLATHAAEPAPVAVEATVVDALQFYDTLAAPTDNSTCACDHFDCTACYPNTPTGNTALVKALDWIVSNTDCVKARDRAYAALNQPAALARGSVAEKGER